jgi:hypothetical protein
MSIGPAAEGRGASLFSRGDYGSSAGASLTVLFLNLSSSGQLPLFVSPKQNSISSSSILILSKVAPNHFDEPLNKNGEPSSVLRWYVAGPEDAP